MRKLLVALKILQVADNYKRNKNGLKRMGKGYSEAWRLNPLNPICYIIVLIAIPVIFVIGGGMVFIKEASNPFKWS
jgi:hypothetical protein